MLFAATVTTIVYRRPSLRCCHAPQLRTRAFQTTLRLTNSLTVSRQQYHAAGIPESQRWCCREEEGPRWHRPNQSNGKSRAVRRSSRTEPNTRDFAIKPAVAVSSSQEHKTQEKQKVPSPTHLEGECSICFEERPLVCLASTRRWHGAACEDCLHRYHVTDAQGSTKNFPPKCFHPLCDHKISAAQLDHHGIFKSDSQREAHHAMTVRAKVERSKNTKSPLRTVLCPSCDMPRAIRRVDRDLVIKCRNCPGSYRVSPFYATLRALERSGWKDKIGDHECWKLCPSCRIVISKGDGCDHVHCGNCETHFFWSEAPDLATHSSRRMRSICGGDVNT